MKNSKILLICSVIIGLSKCTNGLNTEGYYWRDYFGNVPKDALVGGMDYNRIPFYVGQVLYKHILIPAKINGTDFRVYFEWVGPKNIDYTQHNVKILCTITPDQLQWIRTNSTAVHLLTNYHIISGGHEGNRINTYIGHKQLDNEATIGKVLCDDSEKFAFLSVIDGKAVGYDVFEVLIYNPNLDGDDCGCRKVRNSTKEYYEHQNIRKLLF